MEAIGLIAIIILVVLICSLLGWGVKLLGFAGKIIGEGCSSFGNCLFWIFVILLALVALAM